MSVAETEQSGTDAVDVVIVDKQWKTSRSYVAEHEERDEYDGE